MPQIYSKVVQCEDVLVEKLEIKKQWKDTHRFRRPGTIHRSVDYPVPLDGAFGSLPPNVQSVGSRVENLNVPDWASFHCGTRSDRW